MLHTVCYMNVCLTVMFSKQDLAVLYTCCKKVRVVKGFVENFQERGGIVVRLSYCVLDKQLNVSFCEGNA